MEQLRKYFEQSIQMTEKDWLFFSSKLVKKVFPKKTNLIEVGQTEQHLSFIETGIVRFYIPNEYNDLTFNFAFAGNFVSAYDSFLNKQPSRYTIQSLTQITIWQLSFDDLQLIYKETEIGNFIGRKAAEDLFLKKKNRELSLLTETAEQRYLKLFINQKQLIKFIPLKYIASYIGVLPQSLSRIRKRIS